MRWSAACDLEIALLAVSCLVYSIRIQSHQTRLPILPFWSAAFISDSIRVCDT
jgi:hypothetical protein